ncbi:hypothetical protein HanIR_Chr14g0686771 [Helianthus annuus]|nr:hypothetical protein HanIR_Chr14g0686771 [Helianthus annuus]
MSNICLLWIHCSDPVLALINCSSVGFNPNNLPLKQMIPKPFIIVDLYCLINNSLTCPLNCNSKSNQSVSSSSLHSVRSRRSCRSSTPWPSACSLEICFTSPLDLIKVNTWVCLSEFHFSIFESSGFLGRGFIDDEFGDSGLVMTG